MSFDIVSSLPFLVEFQDKIYALNSESIFGVSSFILSNELLSNETGIRQVAHEICIFVRNRPNSLEMIVKLVIELLKVESMKKLTQFLADELLNPAKDISIENSIASFGLLRKLFLGGLYTANEVFGFILRFPESRKIRLFALLCFFAPELNEQLPNQFNILWKRIQGFSIGDSAFLSLYTNFNDYKANNYEKLRMLLDYGCLKSSIQFGIKMNDLRVIERISELNEKLEPAVLEPFSITKSATPVQYAAFYGAYDVFMAIYGKGGDISNALNFAIAGGCKRIIDVCLTQTQLSVKNINSCISSHHREFFDSLLSSVTKDALIAAASFNYIYAVDRIVSSGMDINVSDSNQVLFVFI